MMRFTVLVVLVAATACGPSAAPPKPTRSVSQCTRIAIRPPVNTLENGTKEAWSLDIYDNGAALFNVENCRADGQAVFGSILPAGTFAFSEDTSRLMNELGEQVEWHTVDTYYAQLEYADRTRLEYRLVLPAPVSKELFDRAYRKSVEQGFPQHLEDAWRRSPPPFFDSQPTSTHDK